MYIEFAEYPMNISLLIGSDTEAVFRCQHQSLEATIAWIVNRSSVGLFPNITPGFTRENGRSSVHTDYTSQVKVQWNRGDV